MSFTNRLDGGGSSELEAREEGVSPTFGSEEGVGAIFSLGSKRGPSPSTTEGKVDGGGSWEFEAGEGGDSLGSLT